MPPFQLVSEFQPTGDQPTAIAGLLDGLEKGLQHQTLLPQYLTHKEAHCLQEQ